jgi:hypothetical protein
MKQTKKKMVWLVVFLAIGSIPVFGKPFAVGPYLGQTPPGPIPKVFAPGLICDTRPHHGEGWVSFSADGNTFCFYRDFYVYITENTDQGWTRPEQIKSVPYMVTSPCLSPDANSIYFIPAKNNLRLKHRGLYRCDRTIHGWSEPQLLGPPVSSLVRETSCSIAANNNFYLCSNRKGWDGKSGIWVVPFVDNTWPRAIHLSIDHPLGNDPGIAPDESFMVFYSIRPGALPGTETNLYLTLRLPDGSWSKPRDMGPKINTRYHEFFARISPDKKYLFFTRANGWAADTWDIYWVALKEYLPESYRSPEGMVNDNSSPMKMSSVVKQATGIDSVQAPAEPFAKGPYFGQTPPGSTAQVFAPGLICDTGEHQWESWASFSADGNTFCFNRLGFVYITENTEQGWTTPKNIIGVPYRTASCSLSPDANSIYFIITLKNRRDKHYGLFRCNRTTHGWSEPQELGPTFGYSEGYAGFSLAANNSIYFFHFKPRAGGSGGGMFYAPYENNTWPRLVKLPPVGTFPGIAPDESFMVFAAIRSGGLGETDLYLSLRGADGTWGKAQNLGPKINSGLFEFGARISPDKKYMFFTRSNGWFENPYRNTADIYWVELKEYLPESYR